MNYGLLDKAHLRACAVAVCECLGFGSNGVADLLLMETAGAETNHGTTVDTTVGAGMGITQIDRIPFYDIKDRIPPPDKKIVLEIMGIDIDLIEWEHLRYNPLLCMLFTRLKYKKIPEAIPEDPHGRARYWKQYYNTYAGKGTEVHYLEANNLL